MRFFLILLAATACDDPSAKHAPEPSFIEVRSTLTEDVPVAESGDTGDTGASDAPVQDVLAFSKESRRVRVTGVTLDRNADPYPYTGPVAVTVQPGEVRRIEGGRTHTNSGDTDRGGVTVWYGDAVDGRIDLDVSIANGFGSTRIWVTATNDDNAPGGSFATGVSEAYEIALPTIAEVQREDSHTGNEMEKEHVVFRTDDRQIVVTGITTNGFWVTDLADVGNFGSLFVYSFSKPEGVAVGERLILLSGGVSEHIGVTQLAWPSYETDSAQQLPVPEATVLDAATACSDSMVNSTYELGGTYKTNDLALEAHEASHVRVNKAKIWSGFEMPEDPADLVQYSPEETFYKYGQWPIEIDGGCVVYVLTQTTVPDFDPTAHRGEMLGPISGMLSYAESSRAWILLVSGPSDFPAAGGTDGAAAKTSALIPSPHHFTPRGTFTIREDASIHHGTHQH